jgi:glycosyltransferase involved in cell wall biosynthesis
VTRRLLVLSHGHPHFNRGGGEYAAYAIHRHIGSEEGWQSLFLAAAPAEANEACETIRFVEEDGAWLIPPTNDWLLFESQVDLTSGCELQTLVQQWNPDVVHAHHFYRLGIDVLLAIKRWCPKARWIYTLHEFLPICAYQGQLLRRDGALCDGPTLAGCAECLPQIDRQDLTLRDRFMRLLLEQMDGLIAPSAQLAERFAAWGIPPQKLHVVECPLSDAVLEPDVAVESPLQAVIQEQRPPCRFGFFGNVQPPKGLDLVLEAMLAVVKDQPLATLTIFGKIPQNLDAYPVEQQQSLSLVQSLIRKLGCHCEVIGGYQQADIPALMQRIDWVVMASRWLENSPVVIQEARACRRPLLVPGMGGMAEKVAHGVDGLHFRPGDVVDLASLMLRCSQSWQTWNDLHTSIRPPQPLKEIVAAHLSIYGD